MDKKLLIIIGLIVVVTFIIFILLLSGSIFGGLYLFSSAGTDNDEPLCNPPSIQVGTNCCLDKNNNKICDSDEDLITPLEKTSTTSSPTTTLVTTTTQPIILSACTKDSDCGLKRYRCFGDYFCESGSVYRNCRIDICQNPGESNAYCEVGTKDVLIDECTGEDTCSPGKSQCEKNTGNCQYSPKPELTGSEKINITSEYGEKIQGYQFKMRSKSKDSKGCLEKVYLYMKKPSRVESDLELTWDSYGVFESESVTTGLLESIDESKVTIFVNLPCTLRGTPISGSDTLTVNKKVYSGWGGFNFMIKDILYDPSGKCPERLELEVKRTDTTKETIYPTWTGGATIDSIQIGILKVYDSDIADVWIKP